MRSLLRALTSGLLLIPLTLVAEPMANKADMWIVTVKSGHTSEFEEAFKTHIAFRAGKDDPRAWQVYQPVTGSNLNAYYIRYCCTTWADMDKYRDWARESGTGEHWNANVDQYVESYEHVFSAIDFENSNWPNDLGPVNYVGVSESMVKTGHDAAYAASKKQLSDAAKAGNWPRHWSWVTSVSGANTVALVLPYKDYASMEPPEPSFAEFLAKQMDSEEDAKKALQEYSSHLKFIGYTIYAWREDLSMAVPDSE